MTKYVHTMNAQPLAVNVTPAHDLKALIILSSCLCYYLLWLPTGLLAVHPSSHFISHNNTIN